MSLSLPPRAFHAPRDMITQADYTAITRMLMMLGISPFNVGMSNDGCVWFWAKESPERIQEIRFLITEYLRKQGIGK